MPPNPLPVLRLQTCSEMGVPQGLNQPVEEGDGGGEVGVLALCA